MHPILSVLFLTHLPSITAAGYFFSNHGFYNNSCPVTACSLCGMGRYRAGCINASAGACTNCTSIPNATFNSHGWFNNSCNFTCNEGFVAGPGRSCSQLTKRYTVDFQCSITLLITANETFNMTEYVRAVAVQVGCGQCGSVSISPTTCGACKIAYNYTTSVPVVFRRLLTSGSQVNVNTTITVDNNKNLAETAAASINSSSLSARLPKVASLVVTAPPTVTVQTIIVTPPAPPPPATAAPPAPPAPPPPPPPAPASGGSSNVGAIIGGTMGGVVGLILIAVIVVFSMRKTKTQGTTTTPIPTQVPHTTTTTNSRFTYRQNAQQKTDNFTLSSKFLYVPRQQ